MDRFKKNLPAYHLMPTLPRLSSLRCPTLAPGRFNSPAFHNVLQPCGSSTLSGLSNSPTPSTPQQHRKPINSVKTFTTRSTPLRVEVDDSVNEGRGERPDFMASSITSLVPSFRRWAAAPPRPPNPPPKENRLSSTDRVVHRIQHRQDEYIFCSVPLPIP